MEEWVVVDEGNGWVIDGSLRIMSRRRGFTTRSKHQHDCTCNPSLEAGLLSAAVAGRNFAAHVGTLSGAADAAGVLLGLLTKMGFRVGFAG